MSPVAQAMASMAAALIASEDALKLAERYVVLPPGAREVVAIAQAHLLNSTALELWAGLES